MFLMFIQFKFNSIKILFSIKIQNKKKYIKPLAGQLNYYPTIHITCTNILGLQSTEQTRYEVLGLAVPKHVRNSVPRSAIRDAWYYVIARRSYCSGTHECATILAV